MFEKEFAKAVSEVFASKKQRKFKQSVDLIVNLRNVDFSKPENRLNLDVVLPYEHGKQFDIVIFAEGQMQIEAKKYAKYVYGPDALDQLKNDKKTLSLLVKTCQFLVQPQLMPLVAKSLGPVLGRKGKLPKPLMANIEQSINLLMRTVKVQTKGKYLPTLMCIIGKEDMDQKIIIENANAVIDAIMKKLPGATIKSIYIKLTMGKPVRVI